MAQKNMDPTGPGFVDNEENPSLKSSTSAQSVGTAVTENAELRRAQQPVSCVLELWEKGHTHLTISVF